MTLILIPKPTSGLSHISKSRLGDVSGGRSDSSRHESKKPESDLSNLLCDILVWEGQRRGENPDFAVYNMGGMRASFLKGDITYGDVLAVAPFENKICFLTLTGEKTLELFQQIASEKVKD